MISASSPTLLLFPAVSSHSPAVKMPHRPPSLLTSPLRCPFSSTPVSSDHHRFLLPSQPQHRSPFPSNPFLSFTKHFSSQTLTSEDLSQLSQSLSSELLKPSDSDPFPLSQRLNLSFSHVSFSPPLSLQTLNSSPAAGRAALDFLSWVSSKLPFSDGGLCEQTVKVLSIMEEEGIEPNLIMLNVLINAFGIAGRHKVALSIYHRIIESGISPDVITYTTVMKAFMRAKQFNQIPDLYQEMVSAGCSPDRKARELLNAAVMALEHRF